MLTALVRSALELVFPLTCLGCRREGSVICPACLAGLKRLERPYCDICARPRTPGICARCSQETPAINSIRAPFLFDGTLRDAISQLKYRGMRAGREAVGRTARRIYAVPYARCRCPDARSASPAAFAPAWLQPVGAPGPRIEFVAGTTGGAGIVGSSPKLTASGGHCVPRRTPRERGRGLRRWSGAKQDQSSAH